MNEKRKYHYQNGSKVFDKEKTALSFLIQHNFEPTIHPKRGLIFKKVSCHPEVGVKVTSINNVSYVVGPKENLVRL